MHWREIKEDITLHEMTCPESRILRYRHLMHQWVMFKHLSEDDHVSDNVVHGVPHRA